MAICLVRVIFLMLLKSRMPGFELNILNENEKNIVIYAK
jgi:hypothetical protein